MELTPPITRLTTGRTFYVAISILGGVALLQLGAVGFVFMTRFHSAPPPTTAQLNVPAELPQPTPQKPQARSGVRYWLSWELRQRISVLAWIASITQKEFWSDSRLLNPFLRGIQPTRVNSPSFR